MEAFNFTVANEDCNLYTYDMRKLQSAACMHKVSPFPPYFKAFVNGIRLLVLSNRQEHSPSGNVSKAQWSATAGLCLREVFGCNGE